MLGLAVIAGHMRYAKSKLRAFWAALLMAALLMAALLAGCGEHTPPPVVEYRTRIAIHCDEQLFSAIVTFFTGGKAMPPLALTVDGSSVGTFEVSDGGYFDVWLTEGIHLLNIKDNETFLLGPSRNTIVNVDKNEISTGFGFDFALKYSEIVKAFTLEDITNYEDKKYGAQLNEGDGMYWGTMPEDRMRTKIGDEYIYGPPEEAEAGGSGQAETATDSAAEAGGNGQAETEADSAEGENAWVSANGGLNLRTGPGTQYDIILVIPDGAQIIKLRAEGEWAYVDYDDNTGYANINYLFDEAPEPESDSKNIHNSRYDFWITIPSGWRAIDNSANGDGYFIECENQNIDISVSGIRDLWPEEPGPRIYYDESTVNEFVFDSGMHGWQIAAIDGNKRIIEFCYRSNDRYVTFYVEYGKDIAWFEENRGKILAIAKTLRDG